MATYIQLYTMSTGYIEGTIPPKFGSPKPIPACGDRGVIKVDGRLKERRIVEIALQACRESEFIGYQVLKGDSLLQATPISQVFIVR